VADGSKQLGGGQVLLVAAAPSEANAVAAAFATNGPTEDWRPVDLGEGWSLVRSGVGKVNAALCIARSPIAADGHGTMVVNVGVCGALPRTGGMLPLGSVVIASASMYADEGVRTPCGFQDMASQGFGYWPSARAEPCSSIRADDALVRAADALLRPTIGNRLHIGVIATVSTCSGADALAEEIAARTGAIAEAMEGAAIGHALTRSTGDARRFLEIRVVSNTTGDRERQAWDLRSALETLTRVAGALRGAVGEPPTGRAGGNPAAHAG
jgi:futalosine hydrolase